MFFLKQHLRLCYTFIYIVGCLLISPSLCAQVTPSKGSVDKLFDEVSLELSRAYFEVNNLYFDEKVLNRSQLNVFLRKYFPNSNHKFRKSISRFYQFKDNISSINSPDKIENVVRDCFTFDYDSVKIKNIIYKYFETEIKSEAKGKEQNPSLGSVTKPATTTENEKKQTIPVLSHDKKNGQDTADYFVLAGIFFVLGLVVAILIIRAKTFTIMVEVNKNNCNLEHTNAGNRSLTPAMDIAETGLLIKSNNKDSNVEANVSVENKNDEFKNGLDVSEIASQNTLQTEVSNLEENNQAKNNENSSKLDNAKVEHSVVVEDSLSVTPETSVIAPLIAEVAKENIQMPIESFDEHAVFDNHWLILHTSQIGKSHLAAHPPIPCQDNHAVLSIKDGWGVAVSCDGAGSAQNSYEGSKLVSQKAATYFKNAVEKNGWSDNANLPTEEDWKNISNSILKRIVSEVNEYGKEKGYSLKSLACTIIVIVYSPKGLLCTHIGDGRACYRDQNGQWKAIITPHKGDEANQTIFITSNWMVDGFKMSGKLVPECIIVKEAPTAFALMSDGCETHSFELGYFDKEKDMFFPENKPFVGFFEPIYQQLKSLNNEGLDLKSLNHSWGEFINKGNRGLAEESDDKTLIIGVVKATPDSV